VNLVVVPRALAELRVTVAFYSARANVELALAFVAEFERTANQILQNPKIGMIFRGSRRRYSLRRFPYSVIYYATENELPIVAVAHHRRRPDYWEHRK
jgi:toxin ParE1/3/4